MSSEVGIKLSDIIGRFGKYQMFLLLIIFSTSILSGLTSLTVVLLAPEVNMYWDWEATSSNKTTFRSNDCKMKDIFKHNITSNLSVSTSKLIYESPYSRQTLTQKLELVCERAWLISCANFVMALGFLFGSFVLGRLSEIFGRRLCTIWVGIISLFSNLCILFSNGYVMLALAIFVNGATCYNIKFFIFLGVLEILPKEWSQYVGTFGKSGYLVGQTLYVGVAWLLEDCFYMQIFQIIYTALQVLMLFYTLESPVWLAVRQRYSHAKDTMLTIANRNGLKVEGLEGKVDIYLAQLKTRCEVQSTSEKGKYSDLFKNRVIAFYTVGLCVAWSAIVIVYRALMLNVETFGSGLYLDLTISNLVSLGSILLAVAVLRKISIRLQLCICCICAGIVCAIFPLVFETSLLRSIIAILGRCFMAAPMCISFVYYTEVYPTSMRGVATGFIATVGSLFAAISPFTKELGELTALYVPFILFAVVSFTAAGIYKVMPETKGKELIHTVDELLERRRKPTEISTTTQSHNNIEMSANTS